MGGDAQLFRSALAKYGPGYINALANHRPSAAASSLRRRKRPQERVRSAMLEDTRNLYMPEALGPTITGTGGWKFIFKSEEQLEMEAAFEEFIESTDSMRYLREACEWMQSQFYQYFQVRLTDGTTFQWDVLNHGDPLDNTMLYFGAISLQARMGIIAAFVPKDAFLINSVYLATILQSVHDCCRLIQELFNRQRKSSAAEEGNEVDPGALASFKAAIALWKQFELIVAQVVSESDDDASDSDDDSESDDSDDDDSESEDGDSSGRNAYVEDAASDDDSDDDEEDDIPDNLRLHDFAKDKQPWVKQLLGYNMFANVPMDTLIAKHILAKLSTDELNEILPHDDDAEEKLAMIERNAELRGRKRQREED